MSEPTIAHKFPAKVELEAGKTYAWCACGLSENQPFCDGHHTPTDFKPLVFKAEETKTAYLCQCKHSGHKPYCDGTHKTL
jgi:CDGSH-type Zn-finger protein